MHLSPTTGRHSTSVINTNLNPQKLSPKASPLSRPRRQSFKWVMRFGLQLICSKGKVSAKVLLRNFWWCWAPGHPIHIRPYPLPCVRGIVKTYSTESTTKSLSLHCSNDDVANFQAKTHRIQGEYTASWLYPSCIAIKVYLSFGTAILSQLAHIFTYPSEFELYIPRI